MELPIFANNLRSSASWTTMLHQAHEQWNAAIASNTSRDELEARVCMLQLLHTFQRLGRPLDEREAALLALQPDNPLNQSEPARFIRAARIISTAAQLPEAHLTRDLLLNVFGALTGQAADETLLRRTETLALNAAHDPTPAMLLPKFLDNALDWFTTEGVAEMHTVERATLVYTRLLDLQPFPSHHEAVAQLAASFYTERAGLPPLIIFADELNASRYPAIIESAFRMLTQPLVDFLAENLTRTIQVVTQ